MKAEKEPKNTSSLDKLAQTLTPPSGGTSRAVFLKRARAKYLSNHIAINLANLRSDFKEKYWSAYHCSEVLHQQKSKLISKYCNQRWCLVCNRIRIAKSINSYKVELEKLEHKYFVTLTIPNCKAEVLKETIEKMQKNFTRILNARTVRIFKPKGIRKLECTYNKQSNSYHPHFHVIVSGEQEAKLILENWLKRYPQAKEIAQDVRPCDDKSYLELFKYFTKIATKKDPQPVWFALDIIFKAMYRKRVFQPFGGIKKATEEVEEIEAEEIDWLDPTYDFWHYKNFDWVNEDGQPLTNYVPNERFSKYVENLNSK